MAIAIAREYFTQRKEYANIPVVFDAFDSGEAFVETYISGVYDILFLDIYMKTLTGLDVARQVCLLDAHCHIIFLTSSDAHYPESYEVHAKGYVTKPLKDSASSFCRTMDYVMMRIAATHAGLTIRVNGNELFCPMKEILYYEMNNNRLYFHLLGHVLELAGRYADYAVVLLEDPRFLECYRTLIVNMDYIQRVEDDGLLLKNHKTVPVSRRKRQVVLNRYLKYFLDKGTEK